MVPPNTNNVSMPTVYRAYRRFPAGATLVELVLFFAVILLGVFGLDVLMRRQQATVRDALRLADMRAAQAAFVRLYAATGSYRSAAAPLGCASAGVLLATCDFSRIGVTATVLRDPGKQSYTVRIPPNDTTYAITFALERSHAALAAGEHTLTPAGIE